MILTSFIAIEDVLAFFFIIFVIAGVALRLAAMAAVQHSRQKNMTTAEALLDTLGSIMSGRSRPNRRRRDDEDDSTWL